MEGGTLRLFLLPRRRGGAFLFSPELHQLARRPPAPAQGEENRGGPFRRGLRTAGRRLARRGGAGERILREFRHPGALEVAYAPRLGEEEARALYRELVAGLVRKHRRWLLVDGALLPVGALFTLVPGPNLVFAYLAWRSLAHLRSKRGGERALGELPASFRPEPVLDRLHELQYRRFVWKRKAKIRRLGEALGIEELDRAY